jgi:FKBP-type peptidyl-prolyl cis-trans isomerase FkpA
MSTGGKAILVCPSDLAYGDAGRPSIPPGAALIFEIELLEIATAP